MNRRKNLKHYIIIAAILIYLFIPLIGTLLYSFAGNWDNSVLPQTYTLKWYAVIFSDKRFLASLVRSLLLCGLTLLISVIVMLPTILIVGIYFPKLKKILGILSMIPYAIPGIITAVGLIKLYSSGPVVLTGTIWILIGSYFIIGLPIMYRGIINSLEGINSGVLMEASEMLGVSKIKSFIYVIFPNVLRGITVSSLLTFSLLFGEFVIVNILAGGNFETTPIYLYLQQNKSGHLSSAMVISYYVLIFIVTTAAIKLNKSNQALQ